MVIEKDKWVKGVFETFCFCVGCFKEDSRGGLVCLEGIGVY